MDYRDVLQNLFVMSVFVSAALGWLVKNCLVSKKVYIEINAPREWERLLSFKNELSQHSVFIPGRCHCRLPPSLDGAVSPACLLPPWLLAVCKAFLDRGCAPSMPGGGVWHLEGEVLGRSRIRSRGRTEGSVMSLCTAWLLQMKGVEGRRAVVSTGAECGRARSSAVTLPVSILRNKGDRPTGRN